MDAAATRFQRLHGRVKLLFIRRRNRMILGALTAIIPLVTIFILLEINYREEEAARKSEEAARESTVINTGSLRDSPPARSSGIELEPPRSQWPPLTPPIALFAPPMPVAAVGRSTTGSTEPPRQSVAASRERLPVPPPRPKRAVTANTLR